MELSSYFMVASASLAMAYVLYRLFFINKAGFHIQRFFILGSVAISIIVPLSDIRIFPGRMEAEVTGMLLTVTGAQLIEAQTTLAEKGVFQRIIEFLPSLYIIVSASFIILLMIQVFRILQLYGSSERKREGDIIIIRSEKIKSPFSFFKWVFIPESLSGRQDTNSIIIHEQVHASNYHSLDNLFLEVLTAFMWFNPFLWMMKSSLKLVHEYLADEGTLNSGVEKSRYQAILINQAAEEKLIHIPSSFNNNLKKRIIMMTKSNSRSQRGSGMMTLIPLSLIMFLTVAVLNGLLIQDASASEGVQEKKQTGKKNKNQEIKVVGYGSQKDSEDMNYIVDGVSMKNIDGISPDSIESMNVLKTDKTIVIRTKSFARKNPPESQTTIKIGQDKVLYILDGNKISEAELKNIEPSTIKRLDVIKRKDTIQNYTDEDYDSVVLITTKNHNE